MGQIHDYDKILTRLTIILQRLYEGEVVSVQDLAAEFNVSTKTIQRDFNQRLIRFPIEKQGSKWKMQGGHSLTKERTPEEALVLEMLGKVGIDDPERVADSFPHELSGGQRQRVLIAMALINTPDLLIADEPTTALDVTVQARVLTELRNGLDESGSALLFISHDLAVVSQLCDRIAVMRDGRIVEQGSLPEVLREPRHSYTAGLIATANLDAVAPGERLPVLEDFHDH